MKRSVMKRLPDMLLSGLCMLAMIACERTEELMIPGLPFKVLEYTPAPGQFINERQDCRTAAEAAVWAQDRLEKGEYVSLGAFGGYIVLEFPEGIKNQEGMDFCISGNAHESNSEPGIVWVSDNGMNWYQLEGQEKERRGYSVTYFRNPGGEPGDIRWEDSDGKEGVVEHLSRFHPQDYFPAWIQGTEYTLAGTLLEDRRYRDSQGILHSGNYGAGYADNWSDDTASGVRSSLNHFDISSAIEADGKRADLGKIRFVKIQTGAMASGNTAPVGEISTEVCGISLLQDGCGQS